MRTTYAPFGTRAALFGFTVWSVPVLALPFLVFSGLTYRRAVFLGIVLVAVRTFRVRAAVDKRGIIVHNPLKTHRIPWPEVTWVTGSALRSVVFESCVVVWRRDGSSTPIVASMWPPRYAVQLLEALKTHAPRKQAIKLGLSAVGRKRRWHAAQ